MLSMTPRHLPVHVRTCRCGVAYFDRVTAFKALYLRTSVKGGAQTRCIIASIVAAFTQHVLNPALNRSSEIQRFERSDAIEIRNGIISDFYTGLPHIIFILQFDSWKLSS